ncbi:MAG TPA: sugar phosphate isomerase/epimerase family protein [Chitinophagaceae bacterium]|nr:sugar phosphate isomerase/epimerase family protein [Chitinophagaceae bacterium]
MTCSTMRQSTRKEFLQISSALLLGAAFAKTPFESKKDKLPLAFSTLGCPDWDFKKITDYANKHEYTGIELRGLKREIDLTKCKEFSGTKNIEATLKIMKDKKLKFVDLGSSCTLHFGEGAEREKNINEGKAYIDLAQQLNCPNVRVFPNLLPKDKDKDETMEFIAKGLMELGNYAKASGTMVLMETHGDLVWTHDIEKIMQDASHTNVGLVWDPTNMWTITKEPPAEVFRILKRYIHHTHIKDAKLVDGKPQYVRMGQGEVPIFEAVDALSKSGYKGYYSFEWEKLWHPELEDPETALADYPVAMKKHFNKV